MEKLTLNIKVIISRSGTIKSWQIIIIAAGDP